MNLRIWPCFVCLAAAGVLGCGASSSGPKTVAVSGKVLLDGNPVSGATVTFAPADASGVTAVGKTDASGAYTLQTAAGAKGAPVGKYNVGISKFSTTSAEPPPKTVEESIQRMKEKSKGKPGAPQAAKSEAKDELPAMYGNPQTSGQTADVTANGPNAFEFQLKSK